MKSEHSREDFGYRVIRIKGGPTEDEYAYLVGPPSDSAEVALVPYCHSDALFEAKKMAEEKKTDVAILAVVEVVKYVATPTLTQTVETDDG